MSDNNYKYPSNWNTLRKKTYKRDGYKCQICGITGGKRGNAELHAHHKTPISEGGSHKKSNLKTLCKDCHRNVHNGEIEYKRNFLVVLEVGYIVRDVQDVDDAIMNAVSDMGKRLSDADMRYVDVEVGVTGCPSCGDPFDSAFIASNIALVGLLLEIEIFAVGTKKHAKQIAKNELGDVLEDLSSTVIDTVELENE